MALASKGLPETLGEETARRKRRFIIEISIKMGEKRWPWLQGPSWCVEQPTLIIIEISIKMVEESGALAFAPKGLPQALDSVYRAAHFDHYRDLDKNG